MVNSKEFLKKYIATERYTWKGVNRWRKIELQTSIMYQGRI